MATIRTKPSYTPKCPYCGGTLVGVGFPLPASGKGRCPTGAGPYAFSVETDGTKLVKDKNGNTTKGTKWHVEGPKHD